MVRRPFVAPRSTTPLSVTSRHRHTSLVLYGMEVFFGQGVSIVSPPGTTHVRSVFAIVALGIRQAANVNSAPQHGVPKKKLPCGVTHLDKGTFLEYIDNLRDTYRADAYHLLSFNCQCAPFFRRVALLRPD